MTESLINKKRDKCMIKSKTPIFGNLEYSSGERIRTTPQRGLCDLRVMSNAPESVPFVRRVLQTLALAAGAGVSKPDDLWFKLAGHAAVVNRFSNSSFFHGSVKYLLSAVVVFLRPSGRWLKFH